MKIEHKKIKIEDIVKGFVNNNEEGVLGYSGKLNIRPKYQREFVYKDKQRNEVIKTIEKGFPLNTMYWIKKDNNYELLDGQQRTLSFCEYIEGNFSVDYKYFHNLSEIDKNNILKYEISVYICEGNDKEKLDWFQIINIAGEKLTQQELRNAVYTGEWLTDAKKQFSKTNCPAYLIAKDYLNGSPIRQEFLETALIWISNKNNQKIENYMSKNQNETNANELWLYFQKVINWTEANFIKYRKIMKGLDWGIFYNEYSKNKLDPKKLEKRIQELISDEEIQNKKGIYQYLLSNKEKYLNLRIFDNAIKNLKYEEQKGKCKKCKKDFKIDEMEADHIKAWSKGGKTNLENCQMLCVTCNREKSNK